MSYRRHCELCGRGYEVRLNARYCSASCAGKAKRLSQQDPTGDLTKFNPEGNPSFEVDNKAIKSKAAQMEKKIDKLLLEAKSVAVFLEDNDRGLASAHFSSICDGLHKAKEAAELLS